LVLNERLICPSTRKNLTSGGYRRDSRPVFRLCRPVVFLFFATAFRRAGLLTASVAALPAACFIAGVDRLILARPASSALAVDSSTICAAAFAAAPRASPATDLTPFALRCAASAIASFAFVVTVLTTVHHPPGIAFDNAKSAAMVPKHCSMIRVMLRRYHLPTF
jgi:hypothetical protein